MRSNERVQKQSTVLLYMNWLLMNLFLLNCLLMNLLLTLGPKLISNVKLKGLFAMKRGVRDLENEIKDWDSRLCDAWHGVPTIGMRWLRLVGSLES